MKTFLKWMRDQIREMIAVLHAWEYSSGKKDIKDSVFLQLYFRLVA